MSDGGGSVVSINEYTGVVRRWRRVVLASTVLGAALGTLLLFGRSNEYQAEAVVQVRPIVRQSDDPNLDTSRQINAETEEAIAGSQRVAELALSLRTAAAELDTNDMASPEVMEAAALLDVDPGRARRAATDRLTVSVVSDSQILLFEAIGAEPDRAQALAQSSAVAYLQFRRDQATLGNRESRERLLAREEEILAELADAGARNPGDDDKVTPYREVAKRQELSVIGTKFANLESLTIDPGVILTDAGTPPDPEGLPLFAGPVLGALLGLAGALTGVFLLDRNDDRLRSGRVELGALGVPMLGVAPVIGGRRNRSGGSRSWLYPVNTPGSDAYRRLQGTLLFNLDTEDQTVVLIAGVNSPAAATTVAANVSATAARAGRRTLLIGADLRNNELSRRLGVTSLVGLSDLILGGSSLAESVHPVPGVDNLSLLGAGSRLDRPADVLQSNGLALLIASVRPDYDLVIVEAPPVLRVADAVDIAGLCDGSVLVAESGSESRQAIAESIEQLRGVGSKIVGVVVADAD